MYKVNSECCSLTRYNKAVPSEHSFWHRNIFLPSTIVPATRDKKPVVRILFSFSVWTSIYFLLEIVHIKSLVQCISTIWHFYCLFMTCQTASVVTFILFSFGCNKFILNHISDSLRSDALPKSFPSCGLQNSQNSF
jgi:hypothetical protein